MNTDFWTNIAEEIYQIIFSYNSAENNEPQSSLDQVLIFLFTLDGMASAYHLRVITNSLFQWHIW